MRLFAAARRAIESTRAPPNPFSENSTTAARRICSRVRSGARRLRPDRDSAELRAGDCEDARGVVEGFASSMNHPNERDQRHEAGGAEA